MNFTDIKRFLSDEDAVSPVIGVILMVAITVILAAVIGTFVLGLGDQVQSSAPNANFQFEYSGDFSADSDATIAITHNGGQDVDPDNIEVQFGSAATISSFNGDWTSTISTGSEEVFYEGTTNPGSADTQIGAQVDEGSTVRVIWSSDSGGSSNTIGQSTVPS